MVRMKTKKVNCVPKMVQLDLDTYEAMLFWDVKDNYGEC